MVPAGPLALDSSSEPTSMYVWLVPGLSRSSSVTVSPMATLPVSSFASSTTLTFPKMDSSSKMRPSSLLCSSFAAAYSAFSLRSPKARASSSCLATSWRRTVRRWVSSAVMSS